MATTRETTTPAADAPADDKPTTKSKKSSKGSLTAVVFVPAGTVARDQIFKTAISAVRDKIPVVYTLVPEIESVSDKKQHEGVTGRDYTVKINYDTSVEGAEPVDIDRKIETLTVPSLNDFAVATQVQDVPDNPK
jgi:hypothetical protein